MASELQGKVTLVTVASRGIGKAIAVELARAGCDIMLAARDREALSATADAIRALGRRAEIHVADLLGAGEPEKLALATERAFGGLDVLVNNAGAARRGDFFELSDADWEQGFALKF